jgi:hypothetical protein
MARHQYNPETCTDDCFGCRIQTVSFAASAMPTRSEAAKVERDTAVMHNDVAAYRRLRKDGVQPKSVKGSAELEKRAGSRWEIETGMNLGGNEKIGAKYDAVQAAVNAGETM